MLEQGWMRKCNEDVLAWADDYDRNPYPQGPGKAPTKEKETMIVNPPTSPLDVEVHYLVRRCRGEDERYGLYHVSIPWDPSTTLCGLDWANKAVWIEGVSSKDDMNPVNCKECRKLLIERIAYPLIPLLTYKRSRRKPWTDDLVAEWDIELDREYLGSIGQHGEVFFWQLQSPATYRDRNSLQGNCRSLEVARTSVEKAFRCIWELETIPTC